MDLKDVFHRFIFDKWPIRGEFIHLEESFQTIVNQHHYPAPIKQLLGEALCVAGLLSAIIKFEGRLTVQFRGKGALKLLIAQCDNHHHLRGLVKCDPDVSYADLMAAFHQGILVIMLDSGPKGRYQGIVAWQGNSLAESIEGYFRDSEQLATKIWLSVNDRQAAGLLLQVTPEKLQDVTPIEQEVMQERWEEVVAATQDLSANLMLHLDFEKLLERLYVNEEIRIFEPVTMAFHCTCSRKRSEDAIKLLGKDEAEAEIETKQNIVVTCDFCNKEYIFDRADVSRIFHPPTNLH